MTGGATAATLPPQPIEFAGSQMINIRPIDHYPAISRYTSSNTFEQLIRSRIIFTIANENNVSIGTGPALKYSERFEQIKQILREDEIWDNSWESTEQVAKFLAEKFPNDGLQISASDEGLYYLKWPYKSLYVIAVIESKMARLAVLDEQLDPIEPESNGSLQNMLPRIISTLKARLAYG